MRITVCVKQVPDTGTDRELSQDDGTVIRQAADAVINELDEFAIEEGLRLAEKHGGAVTILSMGPECAAESVRKALAMGADRGVHVCDPALHGADALVTSAILAAALIRDGFDMAVLGSESTDARTGVLAAMLAERLGVPQLSFASRVEADGQQVTVRRLAEYGYDTAEASMPAVVSVVEKINEPRYPS
ncbi:MAG: electron transfer flavoprotein subunit beta/FixA family protein, partial [Trebonia sp.]